MPKIKGSPSGLKQTLAKANVKPKGALWEGPESEGPNGGVTQSLLSRFLCCRERFRVYAIEGLRPRDEWNHRTGYGDMWHKCEEWMGKESVEDSDWKASLKEYVQELLAKYPMQQETIRHWYCVCLIQFPIYVDYWCRNQETRHVEPLLREHPFNIPYMIPSGRIVRLRGKFDGVDLIKEGKGGKNQTIVLDEHKTKGDVDPVALQRQLTFDLQTMLYLVALQEMGRSRELIVPYPGANLRGVNYNVVKRPLSGGKGTIVRHKPSKKNPKGESEEEYYNRLKGIIEEEPQHYFMRWMVEVTPADIERFKKEFLNPALEQLCLWYDVVGRGRTGWPLPGWAVSFRLPYGIYNVIAEGGFSDVDAYLNSGDKTGLKRTDVLFKEL